MEYNEYDYEEEDVKKFMLPGHDGLSVAYNTVATIEKSYKEGIAGEYELWRSSIINNLQNGRWPNLLKAMKEAGYNEKTQCFVTADDDGQKKELFGNDPVFSGLLFKYKDVIILIDVLFDAWDFEYPHREVRPVKEDCKPEHHMVLSQYSPSEITPEMDAIRDFTWAIFDSAGICAGELDCLQDNEFARCYFGDDSDAYKDIETVFDTIEDNLL